jgi:hypothetical protein
VHNPQPADLPLSPDENLSQQSRPSLINPPQKESTPHLSHTRLLTNLMTPGVSKSLTRSGAAVMLARVNHTRSAQLSAAMNSFSLAGVNVIGCIINEFKAT